MFNNFSQNSDNDSDVKRIEEVKNRNQTRGISPSFSNGEDLNTSEIEQNESSDQINEQSQTSNIESTTSNQVESDVNGGSLNNTSQALISSLIDKNLRKKLLLIGIPAFMIIMVIIVIIILAASKEDRSLSKNMLKKFSSVTNSGDFTGTTTNNNTNFPPIGDDEDYDSYFKTNVKEYLIDYLSQNGYCSSDKKNCDKSDAYQFFYKYLKVIVAFERGEGLSDDDAGKYYIDSGLLYETIGYNRSDEEMFLGATASLQANSWLSWIRSLFAPKTNEISKLANKFWIEKVEYEYHPKKKCKIVGKRKYWEFSLNKYVSFLLYGDTMNYITRDECGNLTATNRDLNIEASNVKSFINSDKAGTTNNTHTYKYGGCSATDSDYEGDIKSGYLYMRLKDDPALNVSNDKLEEEIVRIIQEIFNKTVEIYGESSYCGGGGFGASNNGSCSSISISNTSLSREQFISLVNNYAKSTSKSGARILASYAGEIYDMGLKNNINPELVFVRASAEGYSPGSSKNNFWGLGCANKCPSCCKTYSSVMKGVEGFIKNISQYDTIESMMNRYAYIGEAWYKGSSSQGGCYYFNYIADYYDSSPQAQTSKSRAKAACAAGGNESVKTTEYDQLAYSKWQVSTMASNHRKKIFNISSDVCNIGNTNQILSSNASIGEKAALLSVAQFDNFGYSQDYRMSDKYVDCSSLVYRTYKQLGIDFGYKSYAPSANSELTWCQKNNRMISESQLQHGDLLFTYNGVKSGHVEIYIGNGKRFGAHTQHASWKDQVSIKNYNSGYFTLFCRPY